LESIFLFRLFFPFSISSWFAVFQSFLGSFVEF
jgi:hypothetical protein